MTKPLEPQAGPDAVGSPEGFWCSPPRLHGDTQVKRVVDRLLPRDVARCMFFCAIAIGVIASAPLSLQAGLVLGAAVTSVASAYCLLNFWRCREAHCIVSGIGWALLAVFEAAEVALGHSLVHRSEENAFLFVFLVAIAFEWFWRARHGTNAVSFHGAVSSGQRNKLAQFLHWFKES